MVIGKVYCVSPTVNIVFAVNIGFASLPAVTVLVGIVDEGPLIGIVDRVLLVGVVD